MGVLDTVGSKRAKNSPKKPPSSFSEALSEEKELGGFFGLFFALLLPTVPEPPLYMCVKNPFEAKICMNISFQLLLYIMEVKCQEDQQFCSLNFSDVM